MRVKITGAVGILVTMSVALFAAELFIMFGLQKVTIEHPLTEAFTDAFVLILVLFPVLYFLVFRSLVNKNQSLTVVEQELRVAQRQLEDRVDQRTLELQESNDNLSATLRQLETQHEEMTILGEIGHLFQACHDPNEVYEIAAIHIQRRYENIPGALYLFQSSRNILERVVMWKAPGQFDDSFVPDDCWALRRGKVHETTEGNADFGCQHHSLPGGTKGVCLPINANGETLGVLCLLWPDRVEGQEGDPSSDTNTAIPFLTAVDENLALAISNIRFRETLRNQAVRDQLTRLHNRRFLDETMEIEIHRAARTGEPLSMIMIDVDEFKQFNDLNGHDGGDSVLIEIGAYLREHLRKGDIPCRFGGEEFAILLPNADVASAVRRAEEVRSGIEALEILHEGRAIGSVTISCGVATFPIHAKAMKDLLHAADQALYASKANGRNRVTTAELPADARPALETAAAS